MKIIGFDKEHEKTFMLLLNYGHEGLAGESNAVD